MDKITTLTEIINTEKKIYKIISTWYYAWNLGYKANRKGFKNIGICTMFKAELQKKHSELDLAITTICK